MLRFYCHCSLCQSFNQAPYADVTVFRGRAVSLPPDSPVEFSTYRPPPAVQRGKCRICGGAALEYLRLGPVTALSLVPSANFVSRQRLPDPALHIFYDRRQSDSADALPKYSGYWRSQLALSRRLLAALF